MLHAVTQQDATQGVRDKMDAPFCRQAWQQIMKQLPAQFRNRMAARRVAQVDHLVSLFMQIQLQPRHRQRRAP